jgi:hypothetical protein
MEEEKLRSGATSAGFALQIVNTPGGGGAQGSVDELAALGLDRRLRLANGIPISGRSQLVKPRTQKGALQDGHPHGR